MKIIGGFSGRRRGYSTLQAMSMLTVSLVVVVLTGGPALGTAGNSDNITFCHATSAASNPYRVITTDPASIIKRGHGGHIGPVFDPALGQHQPSWGDIIPAFDYPKIGRKPAGHFEGLNLNTSAGQSWL
ncbi:MAG: hypothetical protein ABIP19_13005, partial [Dermatophilaceae bacterium]